MNSWTYVLGMHLLSRIVIAAVGVWVVWRLIIYIKNRYFISQLHYQPMVEKLPVDFKGLFGATPLMGAARCATDVSEINRILEQGANPNQHDRAGNTALMLAVRYNPNVEVIQALIQAGADTFVRSDDNETLLGITARYNTNPAVVTALIAAGVDVNATDNFGRTPLMRAAQSNPNPAVVMALLDAGADKTLRSKEGKRAADYAHENVEIYKTEAFYALDPDKAPME